MPTIQDVAREAGVSVATVSRVINDSSAVSDTARSKVQEAVGRLGYRPNLLGRNLRRTETKMILVLLPNITNPFYSRIVRGIEDIAHKNGYNIMLCNTDADRAREGVYIEMLKNRLSDGVIIFSPEMSSSELSEIGASFPAVQCCEYKAAPGMPYVAIDNAAAAEKAVNHLISLGHARIGFIGSNNSFLTSTDRLKGYRQALEQAGIVYDPQLVKQGDYSYKSGLRAARQLLDLPARPTAIFAISDIMAVGVVKTAAENGLKVPDDLGVIGFDDISFAAMYIPALSTIKQPMYDLGCTAMEVLLRRINGGTAGDEEIILEHELVIRESTMKIK